ncbi:intimin-like protein [Salmonella enterica]|uniref:Intimin-like protein n=1 Tax=Salmonella enterica subsp. houtenae serovar 45:g,z51:- TaxID=1967611 RepID=A0A753B3U0_SALHO|nr:intimin-like protein [Salmonella enterica]EBP3940082.1 intimin-like protein [Salmonella enterica subsp. enterica]ECF6198222.1 intimin-like protein [Salmonella enterica subsp. houtenae]ECT8413725.1 intimin-like protein [Salmonella enterica subsp. houtenae serovar 45:g,z51:-]EHF3220912.1 intimin-like protein [Salmonella enterica subsp. houtenae serovar Houten]
MNIKIKKFLAITQIILQFYPLSFISSFSAYAQKNNQEQASVSSNDNSKNNSQDNTNKESQDKVDQSLAQGAMQAGSLLSSDDIGNSLVSAVDGAASSSIQQWLSQFGTARVNISTDKHFTLNDSDLDLLLPLYDSKQNLFFTQLGGRRHDDRNTVNGGFGYRHFSERWMWGTNVFYDRQISGNQHQRLGFGTELGWDYLKLSANGYLRLSDWMASSRYEDYDERVANGFDVRATGYLPAYPQLGANIIYEQYYGNSVGLFGDDEDDRQKNPHAITVGLNYTPVPLVTVGLNQKMGKNGENDTQVNLALTWTPGVPLSSQLDPSQVALRRSLVGSRMDLVDRNNNIVLDYRKQELISLSLPPLLTGEEQSKQTVVAKVKAKYGLEHIEWQGDSFFSHGGKITASSSPEQFTLTLPAWQNSGVNSYTLTGTAWDKKGNASNASQMKVSVNGMDINTLQSTTTVDPTSVPADGTTTAKVTVVLQTSSGQPATGMASRMSATLSSSNVSAAVTKLKAANQSLKADKTPTISVFTETASGQYTATITSGTTPDTLTIQPLIDGSVKLASAKLIEKATVIIPQLTSLDTSATTALANGTTPITLTAHVTDQYGKALKDVVIDWSDDNTQADLSAAQTTTDAQGDTQVQVTSNAVITTVVTASIEGGNSLNSSSLSFTADLASAKVATIDSEKQQVVANNIDTDKVTAQVTDNSGHPLNGVTVNWTVEKTDNTPVTTKSTATDSSGNAVLTLKSSKTGSVTVSAAVSGTPAQETDPITFVADTASAVVSAIALSKKQAVADGMDSITYTATVTDAQGNVIDGATVHWSADNSNAKLSATQTTSSADGKSQITVTAQKAGTVVVSAGTSSSTLKQADSATFTADINTASVSSLTSDRQSALANGVDEIALSATVVDANGNPLQDADVRWTSDPATGKLSSGTTKTDTHGIAKTTLTSTDVATYSVTAGINGTTKQVSGLRFIADTDTAHLDKLTSSTTSVLADGKTAITLTANVVDQSGHPVKNEQINWSAGNNKAKLSATQSVTDDQGQAQIQVTSSDVITTVVSAQHNQAETLKTDTLSFTADTASAKVVTVSSDKTQVVANNVDSSTVTAQVLDDYNHPLSGITVSWNAKKTDGTSVKSATSVTDSSGNATWILKSAKTGVVTVSAGVGSTAAKETGEITFIADSTSESVSLLTPDKTQATANGMDSITYTATVTDAQGNAVSGATVSWSADNGDAKLSATQTTSGTDGTSQITVTSVKSGGVVVSAQTSEATAKHADSVTFVADPSTAQVSSMTSDKTSALANGADAITVSATITDANDNLLSDSDVSWSATAQDASSAKGKLSVDSSKTDASGVAKVQLTATDVAKFTVMASDNGSSQSLKDLSYTADSSTAQVYSLTADKTTDIVADKDTVTLTALVVDAQQHPVAGATVNWSSSEPDSNLSANSSVTGNDGTTTVTFTSLKAGNIDVTAASGGSSKVQTLQVIGNVATAKVTGITADKTQEVADGKAAITWTAAVTDANGNVLTGTTLNWSASLSGVTLTPTSSDTDANGNATTKGTSLKAGDVKVTATPVTNSNGKKTDGATKFVGDAKTAKLTSLSPSKTKVGINTGGVVYTAVVKDVNSNIVSGVSVAWTTNLNKLSANTSTTDSSGNAKITLDGTTLGVATVTAKANGTTMSNNTVTFVDLIEYDWTVDHNSSNQYTGDIIPNYPSMGFLVSGNTTGPTSLVWNGVPGDSKLTAQLTNDEGKVYTVVFSGSRVTYDCIQMQFNDAATCVGLKNAPVLNFYYSSNPSLPAGHYTGHITFYGEDWQTRQKLLSYDISVSLTK